MKKFLMILLSLGFVGSTAMAFEGALVQTLEGAQIQPLKGGVCPATPVANGGYCKPAGNSCPTGYDQFAKLCWGGWKKGFEKCGISCKPQEQCSWNHSGNYQCSRPRAGSGPQPLVGEMTTVAFEGALVPTLEGAQIQPLKGGVCPATPVANGNYCKPEGKSCPAGYDQFAKLCWGGWKKGFQKCGISCKPKEQCGWDHSGEWRCSRPRAGSGPQPFAGEISGILNLQQDGAVEFKTAKVICEDQGPSAGDNEQWTVCRPTDGKNCGEGYKRMHKYCWGGFKKGIYRCGYVCERSRNANDGNGGYGHDGFHD